MDDKETLEAMDKTAKALGAKLHAALPKDWGFVLLLTQFGDKGQASYISDCEREGAIEAMRQTADRMEKKEAGNGKSRMLDVQETDG